MKRNRIEQIIHQVQVNESIHLSDKSRLDVACHVEGAVLDELGDVMRQRDYWLDMYFKLLKNSDQKKWNEVRLWAKREKQKYPELSIHYNEILRMMDKLDEGESIR